MKASFYNFVIYKANLGYWFNSLSKKFFILERELSKKIEIILNNAQFNLFPSSLLDKLFNSGFIIEDETNELEILRERHRLSKNNKFYKLTILPTLDCNFKCWYCIQDHIPSKMKNEIVVRIKNHLDYMITDQKINGLNIEWFGGEPFLYFEDIIKPITHYALKKCEHANIPFWGGATTNGYLLINDTISQLRDLQLNYFQITIDGNKEFHDKVKFNDKGLSAFDQTLSNINLLLSSNPDASIFLRINYDHRNLTEEIVAQIDNWINKENRNRITVIARKVWQTPVDKNYTFFLQSILKKFEKAGYKTHKWTPISDYLPCYTNRKFYNTINFNGHTLKCTACKDLYSKEPKGILNKDGSISWENGFDDKYLDCTFENERCLACKELPICMGNCPKDFINGISGCKKSRMDQTLENSLIEYIEYHENN